MNKLQTIFMNLFPSSPKLADSLCHYTDTITILLHGNKHVQKEDWVVIDTSLKGYNYEDKNASNKNIFVERA